MHIPEDGCLLRIFVGESDRWKGVPLYEAIVRKAKAEGLAGATVIRGIMGFGASSRIHTAGILRLSEDLPIVVEIVDTRDRIDPFVDAIDPMIREGMITVEKAHVLRYRHRDTAQS